MYRTLRHPLPPPSLPLPPHPVIPHSHLPPPHHSHDDLKKKCQKICKIYVSSEIHKLSFELLRIFLFFAANCTYLTIVFYQFCHDPSHFHDVSTFYRYPKSVKIKEMKTSWPLSKIFYLKDDKVNI